MSRELIAFAVLAAIVFAGTLWVRSMRKSRLQPPSTDPVEDFRAKFNNRKLDVLARMAAEVISTELCCSAAESAKLVLSEALRLTEDRLRAHDEGDHLDDIERYCAERFELVMRLDKAYLQPFIQVQIHHEALGDRISDVYTVMREIIEALRKKPDRVKREGTVMRTVLEQEADSAWRAGQKFLARAGSEDFVDGKLPLTPLVIEFRSKWMAARSDLRQRLLEEAGGAESGE